MAWVQIPSNTPIHWYSIMVNAGVLYTQDYRFKSYYQYYLGVPEWSMCYIDKLIKNNTGVSSKNFFLVAVTLIGLILLLVPAVLLIIEVCYNHTIQTDLNGLAAYIGAVAGVFASAGITKAWSEKYEKK